MDAIDMIKERRSVRKYRDGKVDRKTMEEIVEISRWAPSWANTQIAATLWLTINRSLQS